MIIPFRKALVSVMIVSLSTLMILTGCKKNSTPSNGQDQTDAPVVANAQIFDFKPLKGLPGTVVKIRGLDFNTKISENIVYVGSDKLEIISITSKEIVAVIPANAKVGSGTLAVYYDGKSVAAVSKFSVLRGVQSTFAKMAFNDVLYVGLDDYDNTYGSDGKYIYKVALNGGSSAMTPSNDDFKSIAGFAFNLSGDIYIANKGNFNIMKTTPQKVTTVFAGSGTQGYEDGPSASAKFMAPAGIVYYLGLLYVIDGHRIRKISYTGIVTTLAGSGADGNADGVGTSAQFGTLEGIAVDRDGNVYVTDSKYLNIRRITEDGKVTTLAGSGSTGFKDGMASAAQFTKPRSIAVDASGNLFVADGNGALPYYAIRMINQAGDVFTLIKGTTNADILNGEIASATTNSPLGLCFDHAGNLYIANSGAKTISKVSFSL
jgi:hypothetical protein